MFPVRGDLLNVFGVSSSCGADDDEVRVGRFHARVDVGENMFRGNREIGYGFFHPCGVIVADAGDGSRRVFVNLAKKVAHVHVIEIDADDFPVFLSWVHLARCCVFFPQSPFAVWAILSGIWRTDPQDSRSVISVVVSILRAPISSNKDREAAAPAA